MNRHGRLLLAQRITQRMIYEGSLLFLFFSFTSAILNADGEAKQPGLEGLPGAIVQKLRDHRHEQTVDLLEELQGTFEWANSQPEWAEFSFPVDQTLPGLPLIGDIQLHIESLRFHKFDASKDEQESPIVERTSKGYRLGLFNIALDLEGIEVTTFGFLGSTHRGMMSLELNDCYLEIEMVEGQEVPNVIGKIGSAAYSFESPNFMTQMMLSPLLLLAESMISGTIESAFAYYLTQFWLPVDMEFYISIAAEAYLDSEDSTVGELEELEFADLEQIDDEYEAPGFGGKCLFDEVKEDEMRYRFCRE